MLPNFLIIGAEKAATSWLAVCLSEHPDVFMVKEKEIYFFTGHFEKGLTWYEPYFNDWSGQSAIGEATPGYISHPDAPGRIRATLGDKIKLIASLRHPVDRAYSAFWHYIRNGRLPPDADFCTLFREGDPFKIRSRGYYFAQLSQYLEYFSRENLLILIYEEIFKDSQQAIANCLEFLDIDTQFEPKSLNAKIHTGSKDISIFHRQVLRSRLKLRRALAQAVELNLLPRRLQKPFFEMGHRFFKHSAFEWGPKQKQFERLNEGVRQDLLEHYMPDIRQLEDLLDRDLSIWYK